MLDSCVYYVELIAADLSCQLMCYYWDILWKIKSLLWKTIEDAKNSEILISKVLDFGSEELREKKICGSSKSGTLMMLLRWSVIDGIVS